MTDIYYNRHIEPVLETASRQFPAVILTGVRQSGKSTLLEHAFPDHTLLTLDDIRLRNLARNDPELLISSYNEPLLIDEVQYAPQLLSSLKIRIDKQRNSYGRYILTGSQMLQMMQGISETLAGRIAVLHLHPFSWNEMTDSIPDTSRVNAQIIRGFYPELHVRNDSDAELWFSSYISTYLERDVRNIKQINDLGMFRDFISLLAARIGRQLNLAEIAKECGVSQPTARSWLGILESTHLIYLLRAYHRNISKRVVKSPKLYFMDTGLACYLLGIDTPERLLKAAEKGHLFENMVIAEVVKRASFSTGKMDLWYYRTQSGVEVDLIIDCKGEYRAYEIKFSETPRPHMADSLKLFENEVHCEESAVLCQIRKPLPLNSSVSAVHWYEGLRCV